MATCAAHLARNGIAYVSFNAHPGGHFRRSLRELALWQTRNYEDPAQRAQRSRELFASLRSLRDESDPWGALLAAGCRAVGRADRPSSTTCSASLEPVWFADFAGVAQRNGLQYAARPAFIASPGRGSRRWAKLWRLAEGSHRLSAACRFHGLAAVSRFLLCHAGRDVSDTSITAAAGGASDPVVHSPSKTCRPRDPSNARRTLATAREVRPAACSGPIRTNSQALLGSRAAAIVTIPRAAIAR